MLKSLPLTACPPPHARPFWAWMLAGVLAWGGSASNALAQTTSSTGAIYTCIDSAGKRLTSDRLISECLDREQRVLNRDGSVRMVLPPRMSTEERAAAEARKRELSKTLTVAVPSKLSCLMPSLFTICPASSVTVKATSESGSKVAGILSTDFPRLTWS